MWWGFFFTVNKKISRGRINNKKIKKDILKKKRQCIKGNSESGRQAGGAREDSPIGQRLEGSVHVAGVTDVLQTCEA